MAVAVNQLKKLVYGLTKAKGAGFSVEPRPNFELISSSPAHPIFPDSDAAERIHRRYPTYPRLTTKSLAEAVRRHGRRLDYHERKRKKEAREVNRASKVAKSLTGLKAKLHNRKRAVAKIQMKKQIKQHEQRNVKTSQEASAPDGAVPTYLLDRAEEKSAKQLSSMVKQKRKEAAARFSVPLPKVRGMAEEEVFKVLKTGKSKGKSWKRVITKPTFVGEGFTRRPVKVPSPLWHVFWG
jgi:hypothetical protein